MLPLITTIILASLLGSLHCAGMCGAFVVFAVSSDPEDRSSRIPLHIAYHVGRLATYVVFGMAAGLVGQAFDFGGDLLGVQKLAAALAGAMMIVFGGIALLRIRGVPVPKAPIPKALEHAAVKGHMLAAQQAPVVRALVTGLLTTFLPCGWLYAFVITAAGTGSPRLGAITMVAFWIGTIPVLVVVGVGVQKLLGAFGRRLPAVTAVAVMAVGLYTVLDRAVLIDTLDAGVVSPVSEDLVEHVRSLRSSEAACCDVPDDAK